MSRGDLVDTQVAAVAAGVSPATIRSWAHRGHLERRGRDKRGRVLYSLLDVRRVHREKTERTTVGQRGVQQ